MVTEVHPDRTHHPSDPRTTTAPTASAPPVPVHAGWREMIRDYIRVLRAERRLAAMSVALYAISGAAEGAGLGMLVPLFKEIGRSGTDRGAFGRLLESLGFHGHALAWAALAGFALSGLVASGCKFAAFSTTSVVRARLEARLRKELTGSLLRMKWSAFLMMRFDEMANSLMMESFQVGLGIRQFLIVTGSFLVAVTLGAIALLLSVRLTLYVVAFAALSFVVLKPVGRRAEQYTRGWTAAALGIARQVSEVLGNLKFFRSSGSSATAQGLFSQEYDEYATWYARIQISPYTTQLTYEVIGLAFLTTLLAVSLGTSTLSATTIVFLAIFFRLSPRVGDLQSGAVTLRVQFPWLVRWNERQAAADAAHGRTPGSRLPTFSAKLAAEQVSFAFSADGPRVLDGVSWELRPGEVVAFVGESGSGKTTMLDLVTGLLAPSEGRITVDGIPVAELDIEAWQSHIGLVLQESPMFYSTVRQNIIGGRDIDEDLIWECLAAAHADGFARELPDGLDTMIGERGARLSGGQRQRLGLARALYRRPWLLILDEATSQLDSVAENVILEALKGLKGRVAMLIVAHRIATVELADRIFVLDGGRIVQSGSWQELLADEEGLFARMARKQGMLVGAAS
jgi:ATP-binding cassette, subfamily C, bacterial